MQILWAERHGNARLDRILSLGGMIVSNPWWAHKPSAPADIKSSCREEDRAERQGLSVPTGRLSELGKPCPPANGDLREGVPHPARLAGADDSMARQW